MTTDKLKQIIERENENLEQEAVRNATNIIASISKLRRQVQCIEADIVELQSELKKIEVTKIDPIQILGA